MSPAKRRIRLDLAYDGTDFAGWQIQPDRRTVQGVLEVELCRLNGGVPVRLRGAGRTDAGVHARGQVADCEVPAGLSDEDVQYALRRMLACDVRPLRVRGVLPDFHARRNATGKTYTYRIDRSPHGDPFQVRYALHCPFDLDQDLMRQALELLPGRRDWSGFTGAACEIDDRVRNLTEARFDVQRARFAFCADGFLNHMVRNLVGTLLEIGRRKMPPERIEQILASRDRSLAGPTAPARGLCLEHVAYPEGAAP